MRFDDEIIRAVKHQVAIDSDNTKSDDDVADIVTAVRLAISSSSYDFSNFDSTTLSQGVKKRNVKQFPDIYSPESVLCQCIKRILDR